MTTKTKELDERELPDDYPIYAGYLYVADGKVVRATQPSTVAEWKRHRKVVSVTSCDINGRDLWDQAI
jgi:hypothetical protein